MSRLACAHEQLLALAHEPDQIDDELVYGGGGGAVFIALRKHICEHLRTFDVRTEVRLPACVIKAAGLRPLNIILLLIFSFNYWLHNS